MVLKNTKYDIQEGDLILVHSKKGIVPKLIRTFSKCYYNHAAIVVKAMNELYVLEATGRGLLITQSLEEYLKETPSKREILIRRPKRQSEEGILKAYEALSEIIGNKYDFKSLLFSQFIYQITDEKSWKGKKGAKAANKVYCSEAYAYAYSDLFPKWWSVAPVDLFESVKLKTILKL